MLSVANELFSSVTTPPRQTPPTRTTFWSRSGWYGDAPTSIGTHRSVVPAIHLGLCGTDGNSGPIFEQWQLKLDAVIFLSAALLR